MHVLVVSDEEWVREDLDAALSEDRFELTHVSDPHGAAEACREAGADVVIADLQVASMGGMAVIRSIRAAVAAGDLPATPTVLLMDRGADAFIAGRAGADAALRKPFGAFELREILDSLVGAAAETS